MEVFIVIVLIVALLFYFKPKKDDTKQVTVTMENIDYDAVEVDKSKDSYGTSLTADFSSKIPKGYQILFNMRDIALGYNIESARDFVKGKDYSIVLYPEQQNRNDKNAVAIYSSRGKLGYIPREIAPMLHDDELMSKIILRIKHMWVGEKRGSMDLQILAPKEIVKSMKTS